MLNHAIHAYNRQKNINCPENMKILLSVSDPQSSTTVKDRERAWEPSSVITSIIAVVDGLTQ
jgi:hypothetical protein